MNEDRRTLFEQIYPQIAGDLFQLYLDLLAESREAFDGDLDKALILLAIGVRTGKHPDYKSFTIDELRSGDLPAVMPCQGTNVRSVADWVRVPRETVRRKVEDLLRTGWLERSGRNLRYSAEAIRKFGPLREAFMRMVFGHFEVVSAALPSRPPTHLARP